ncbi:hypothetical protein [Cellulosimicrobium marinum]|uniref:hypothetical protein n=1 Tax=Cellulosimicrobium marinum TaxID=1638992 RepID=UPI001E4B9FC3|nr:hypothetical protein [Cellulosimicrobium marinum]MCB7135879.1 hypothetical protein [Cellulosimicrobium marinum]
MSPVPRDRAPLPISLDPPRGAFPACVLTVAADPRTVSAWVAAAFDEHRWKTRTTAAARHEGAELWEIGGPVRSFFLADQFDVVVRAVAPRAAAWLVHGQAVSHVAAGSPGTSGTAGTTLTLSLVHGLLECRESLAHVARAVHDRAVREGAVHPHAVPTWTAAHDLPPGSPGDPRARRRLFRGP